MAEWPAELLSRRFSPREVAELTGVSEPRQRLLASRHFDFRESVQPEKGRRRWTWEGIQTLSVFADVMEDLRDADRALAVATGRAENSDRALFYQHDSRAEADTLVLYNFDRPGPAAGSIGTAQGLADQFGYGNTDLRPNRLYSYNLSAMQRRLCAKLKVD